MSRRVKALSLCLWVSLAHLCAVVPRGAPAEASTSPLLLLRDSHLLLLLLHLLHLLLLSVVSSISWSSVCVWCVFTWSCGVNTHTFLHTPGTLFTFSFFFLHVCFFRSFISLSQFSLFPSSSFICFLFSTYFTLSSFYLLFLTLPALLSFLSSLMFFFPPFPSSTFVSCFPSCLPSYSYLFPLFFTFLSCLHVFPLHYSFLFSLFMICFRFLLFLVSSFLLIHLLPPYVPFNLLPFFLSFLPFSHHHFLSFPLSFHLTSSPLLIHRFVSFPLTSSLSSSSDPFIIPLSVCVCVYLFINPVIVINSHRCGNPLRCRHSD